MYFSFHCSYFRTVGDCSQACLESLSFYSFKLVLSSTKYNFHTFLVCDDEMKCTPPWISTVYTEPVLLVVFATSSASVWTTLGLVKVKNVWKLFNLVVILTWPNISCRLFINVGNKKSGNAITLLYSLNFLTYSVLFSTFCDMKLEKTFLYCL